MLSSVAKVNKLARLFYKELRFVIQLQLREMVLNGLRELFGELDHNKWEVCGCLLVC